MQEPSLASRMYGISPKDEKQGAYFEVWLKDIWTNNWYEAKVSDESEKATLYTLDFVYCTLLPTLVFVTRTEVCNTMSAR